MKTEKKVKLSWSMDGLDHYVLDDGTWDGSREDSLRLPMAEVGYDESVNDAVEIFRSRGLL